MFIVHSEDSDNCFVLSVSCFSAVFVIWLNFGLLGVGKAIVA